MNQAPLPWEVSLIVAVVCGVFGGLTNAVINGGERYQIRLPFRSGRQIELGFLGPLFVGVIAAVVALGGAFIDAKPSQLIVACLLAGVSGSNYLTNRIRTRNLRSATDQAAEAAKEAARQV